MNEESEIERLRRWTASLLRSSADTRDQAARNGPGWEFYDLTMASSEAQALDASATEAKIASLVHWEAASRSGAAF